MKNLKLDEVTIYEDKPFVRLTITGELSPTTYIGLEDAKKIRDFLTDWIEWQEGTRPFCKDLSEWDWPDSDEPPVLIGVSDGVVGSPLLGQCEHCYELPRGVKYYAAHGTYWCEGCIESGA